MGLLVLTEKSSAAVASTNKAWCLWAFKWPDTRNYQLNIKLVLRNKIWQERVTYGKVTLRSQFKQTTLQPADNCPLWKRKVAHQTQVAHMVSVDKTTTKY